MSLGVARGLTALFFVLMMVFTTWPGMVPFARVRPLILGLPFSFAWVAIWIVASILVLLGLDRVERRYRAPADDSAEEGV